MKHLSDIWRTCFLLLEEFEVLFGCWKHFFLHPTLLFVLRRLWKTHRLYAILRLFFYSFFSLIKLDRKWVFFLKQLKSKRKRSLENLKNYRWNPLWGLQKVFMFGGKGGLDGGSVLLKERATRRSRTFKALHVTKESIRDVWPHPVSLACARLHTDAHVWLFEGLVSCYYVSYSKLHAAFPPSVLFIRTLLPTFLHSPTMDSENVRRRSSFLHARRGRVSGFSPRGPRPPGGNRRTEWDVGRGGRAGEAESAEVRKVMSCCSFVSHLLLGLSCAPPPVLPAHRGTNAELIGSASWRLTCARTCQKMAVCSLLCHFQNV